MDGSLEFEALLDDTDFRAKLKKLMGDISTTSQQSETAVNGLSSSLLNIGKMAASAFTIQQATQFVSALISVRSEFQNIEASMRVFLGTTEKAGEFMQKLQKYAFNNVFEFKDLAQASTQLLAFRNEAEDVIPIIDKLSNIAAGMNAPLSDFVDLFNKAKSLGRLQTADIQQWATKGIDVVYELSKALGKTEEEIRGMVTAGQVGFEDLNVVINNLTGSGGMFAGMMEEKMKTLGDSVGLLEDNVTSMFNEIGQASESFLRGGILAINALAENYQKVGKVIAALVATYGTYKAAVIAVMLVEKERAAITSMMAASNGVFTKGLAYQWVWTERLQKAQALLNKTLSANPYIFAAVAVVGVATAMWALRDSSTAAERAQSKVADIMERVNESADALSQKTNEYISILEDENAANFQKAMAYQKLQLLYPEILKNITLETFLTQKLVSIRKELNEEQGKRSKDEIAREIEEAVSRIAKMEKELSVVFGSIEKMRNNPISKNSPRVKDYEEELIILSKLKKELKDVEDAEWEANTPLERKIAIQEKVLTGLQKWKDELAKSLDGAKKINGEFVSFQDMVNAMQFDALVSKIEMVKSKIAQWKEAASVTVQVDSIDNLRAAMQEAQKNRDKAAIGSKEFKEWDAEFKKLKNRLDGLSETSKQTSKSVQEVFAVGSVAEYDRQIQKLQDRLNKINPAANGPLVSKLQADLLELQIQRAETAKRIEIKSFEEQIEEKKAQYSQYEEWVLNYGKEIADAQFKDLIANGTSFIDFLQSKLTKLDAKVFAGKASKLEGENANLLLKYIRDARGQKSAIDQFVADMEALKRGSESLSQYINNLKEKEAELIGDTSELAVQKTLWLYGEIANAQNERTAELGRFLQQVRYNESEQARIAAYYADMRAEAEKLSAEERKKVLAEIATAEKEANEQLREDQVRKLEAVKKLSYEVFGTGRQRIAEEYKRLQEAFQSAMDLTGGDMANDEVVRLFNEMNAKKRELSDFDISKWKEWSTIVSQAGGSLSGIPGIMGDVGAAMSSLGDGAQQVLDNLAKAKSEAGLSTGDVIAQGIATLTQWTVAIIQGVEQRRRAEESYYTSVTSMQHSYNLAIIEQLRLQESLRTNYFSTDYLGVIQANWAGAQKALASYSDAMLALQDAEVKVGTKRKMDWGVLGASVSSGAGLGTGIGAIAGGGILSLPAAAVGAIIGTVVGGITGVVAGLKKVDKYASLLEAYPDLIDSKGMLNKDRAQALLDAELLKGKSKEALQYALKVQEAYEEALKTIDDIIKGLVGNLGGQLSDALVTAFQDGTDAAYDFKNTVENILSDALSSIIFSTVFADAFEKLSESLRESLTEGDGEISDDFAAFLEQYPSLIEQFNEMMSDARSQAEALGLDIFGKGKGSANSLEGAIKGVSESTASLIAGQMNAIRINQGESISLVKQQLLHLSIIANNSQYLIYLMSIDARLSQLDSGSYRPFGIANI